jgi:hypothetical protein
LADLNKDIANVETELKTWKAPVKDFEADLEKSAAYFEKVGRHLPNLEQVLIADYSTGYRLIWSTL